MDISNEYIKMCEKASEIQALNKYNSSLCGIWFKDDYVFYAIEDVNGIKTIWLPRQEQLQEMIDNNNIEANLDLWWRWRDEGGGVLDPRRYDSLIQSMEQCWLIFVMFEQYKKKWDGEIWKNMKYNKMLGRFE